MKLIKNISGNRVIDLLNMSESATGVEVATNGFSVYGFSEFLKQLDQSGPIKLILPADATELNKLWGDETERELRNKLNAQQLSQKSLDALRDKVELRVSRSPLPQSIIAI